MHYRQLLSAIAQAHTSAVGRAAAAVNQGLFLRREHARLTPRPTGGEESNGLGLAIVKHLIESQGGTTGAEFPATGGSLFWFELPAAT